MPDEEKLVRMLSLHERKEAVEEFLNRIDHQTAMIQSIYRRHMTDLERQRKQALALMQDIIREETRERNE